jgi:hypothetical protein
MLQERKRKEGRRGREGGRDRVNGDGNGSIEREREREPLVYRRRCSWA